jgi:hypothetical protein
MSHSTSSSQKKLLIFVTALVWVAAIATSAGKFKLAARGPITIELATRPTSVKVTINNEKQFEGMYIETPKQIKIAGGVNKIKISREGYISSLFTVDAVSGETINMSEVVLQRNPELQFQQLEISHDDQSEPVYVSVANGLITGETPISTDDAIRGSTYVITVYPAWPAKEPSVRCRVKMPGSEQGEDEGEAIKMSPYKVTIKRASKTQQQLTFKGCDKLKQK